MRAFGKSIYVITLFIGIILISCGGSDDSDPPQNPPGAGTFTATVAEATTTNYVADITNGVLTKTDMSGSEQYTFYVKGQETSTNRLIHFFIYTPTETVPGTYYLKVTDVNQAYYIENYDTSSAKGWLAPDYSDPDPNKIHGTVNITELTTDRAKGTFSFSAVEDVTGATLRTVTNGSFDVPLTRQGF